MQIFDDMKFDLIIRIITLTYVLMKNFYPCFIFCIKYFKKLSDSGVVSTKII